MEAFANHNDALSFKIPNPGRFRELVEIGTQRRGKQLVVCLEAELHPSTLHRMTKGEIRPKPHKLLKLARALLLTESETYDLFLAAGSSAPVLNSVARNSSELLIANLAMEKAWPLPAYVTDLVGNLIARNLMVDLVWGHLPDEANLTELMFDRYHRPLPLAELNQNWEHWALLTLNGLKSLYLKSSGNAQIRAEIEVLLEKLLDNPQRYAGFEKLWQRATGQEQIGAHNTLKVVQHPMAGKLEFQMFVAQGSQGGGLNIVNYYPKDSLTLHRLYALIESRPALPHAEKYCERCYNVDLSKIIS
jgi:MmyB-like transcription regulator ligand binding domain